MGEYLKWLGEVKAGCRATGMYLFAHVANKCGNWEIGALGSTKKSSRSSHDFEDNK